MASKKPAVDRGFVVSLPKETVAELDRVRTRVGKGSVEEVVHDAISFYLRLKEPEQVPLERLTPRLRQVLEMVADGCTTKEIAQNLGISVKTADWHRAQLMKVLNLHGVVDVVRYAIRVGIIHP